MVKEAGSERARDRKRKALGWEAVEVEGGKGPREGRNCCFSMSTRSRRSKKAPKESNLNESKQRPDDATAGTPKPYAAACSFIRLIQCSHYLPVLC